MFAVPGWSVSANQLKAQQESDDKEKTGKANPNGHSIVEGKKSKKRKRGHGEGNGTLVAEDNIADLWEKHIEGKSKRQKAGDGNPQKDKKKRIRKQKRIVRVEAGEEKLAPAAQDTERISQLVCTTTKLSGKNTTAPTDPSGATRDGKITNEQSKVKGHFKPQSQKSSTLPSSQPSSAGSNPIAAPTLSVELLPLAPPPLPSNAKLTPLQTAMRAKLISARFRHLNETLYTTPSTHASTLFSSNPEAFASYHIGFRAQVASWPSNPVDIFIEEIKSRGALGGPRSQKQLWRAEKRKKGAKKEDAQNGVSEVPVSNVGEFTKTDPLPRHFQRKTCTIADLGCGDAHLHASLLPLAESLNLKLHSFDLAPGAGTNAHLITVSDIARLPLADGSADIAIFCLALMGTNWIDFVAEAARVVRTGGECWVGEVRSRFAGTKDMEKLKADKGGSGKAKKRKKGVGEDEDVKKVGAPIQVEEEEIAGGKQGKPKEQETDVGPFLEVFRRRGFVLKGEVDLGNKMFVRMRFGRVRDSGASGSKPQGGTKFVERDDGDGMEMDPEMEAKVLKPCVYKTR
ncbi:MAG: hypothetical protein Q9209_004372 [Squamulea sp. 1 TL-2023]